MTFTDYFDQTHELTRKTVRRFLELEVRPHLDDWEEAGEFPRELYRKAGKVGILGIGYPEALGGSGEGDVFLKVAASEELMRCGSGGFVAGLCSLDIAIPPIVRRGNQALKERVVRPALRGEKICALAVTEPGGGSDVAGLRTRAVRQGDHYRLDGSKTFITSGARADCYTVAVRTGGEGAGGISLLLVEKGTPGFAVGRTLRKMGWWCSDTAELFFDDCRVPAANLIGEENQGFVLLAENFQMERLALAVMANVTAELALEECQRWVRQRRAFGRSIGEFQVIRHRLAEMATLVEASRQMTYRQAARVQAGQGAVKEISMAKNFATDAADRVTWDAVQIFGGSGYMRGSLVERLYRDARVLSIGGGTREIMNEVICRQMGL
jgi:acyl-CoA dehydrogenase